MSNNPNFMPTYSTDNIWRDDDMERCLSDDLDNIESDIAALESGKANAEHVHTGYAAEGHSHTGYAIEGHSHSEYAVGDHDHCCLLPAGNQGDGGADPGRGQLLFHRCTSE